MTTEEPHKAPRTHAISVRDLVSFVWREGDFGRTDEFATHQRALDGIEGHQRVQDSRPAGYVREHSVRDEVVHNGFRLIVRGRIDGYWVDAHGSLHLEEIKTRVRPGLPRPEPMALHWGQAKVYACLLARSQTPRPATLRIQLTYLALSTGECEEPVMESSVEDLESFYQGTIARYLAWLDLQEAWIRRRTDSIHASGFPFADFRRGQRDLAKAVFRAAKQGHRVFAEAPTGIGKTLSALFPAAKALGEGAIQQILYLTAKTSGRVLAESALQELERVGFRLRAVTLPARSRVCVRDGRPCDPETCSRARGYYTRRHPALEAATALTALSREGIEALGARFDLCPYALAHDLAPWADVVIGDYNHLFDPRSRLGFLEEASNGVMALIDEAHNLPDRAREMFSAALYPDRFAALATSARRQAPALAKIAQALAKTLRKCIQPANPKPAETVVPTGDQDPWLFPEAAPTPTEAIPQGGTEVLMKAEAPDQAGNLRRISREAPSGLDGALEGFLEIAGAWLAEVDPAPDWEPEVRTLFFETGAALSSLRRFGDADVCLTETSPVPMLKLFCIDPAPRLSSVIESIAAAAFFSATLSPMDFFRASLGGTDTDRTLKLVSPFPSEHFCVLVEDKLETQLRAREASRTAVAESILAFVGAHTGNYLAFFPSHTYLSSVLETVKTLAPELEVWAQSPGMTEHDKAGFLGRFESTPTTTRLGFAVLGGLFGEGVDLVGDRLSGAVIVSVGLPQIGFERETMREHFETVHGKGFEFAYAFPGMNRVVQAAGRVIRSETDRGAVLLIDRRFGEPRFRSLLPPWWKPQTARGTKAIHTAAATFWQTTETAVPHSPPEDR